MYTQSIPHVVQTPLCHRGPVSLGPSRSAPSMMKRKHGYKTMIMFGDGATDMDARTQGPAAAFIGFGGVTVRPNIKAPRATPGFGATPLFCRRVG